MFELQRAVSRAISSEKIKRPRLSGPGPNLAGWGLVREWLIFLAQNAMTIINGLALVIIVVGTIETVINGVRFMFHAPSGHLVREVLPASWLPF